MVEIIKNKIVTPPCKVLDIGCGTGNYSIYLAQKRFEVTGIDFSENALKIARKRAKKTGLKIKFIKADVTKLKDTLTAKFDFILDYSILHHIPDYKTRSYARQFSKLLNQKGKLLLVCYSEKDELAQGGYSAKGKYGNTMYYRSVEEIRNAYKDLHEISFQEARLGKRLHHLGYSFLFEN